MAVLSIGDKRLGAMLLERGFISDEGLQRAIARQAETGGRLSEVLINLGLLSEQRIARAIEEAMGVPLVHLTRTPTDPQALAKVPAALALELRALPFALQGTRLRVAFEDPLDALAAEELEDVSGCIVEVFQALGSELTWALATHYPELGLTPPAELNPALGSRVGELALTLGLITREQLEAALAQQARTGGLLGSILQEQGALSDVQLAELLAQQADLPFTADLRGARISERLASHLLRVDALQYRAVPYQEEADGLVVALADPRRADDLREIIRTPVRFVVAPESQVQALTDALYEHDKGRLGETLLQAGKLRREQLREALYEQQKRGRVRPLGDILVDLGFVSREDVQWALAEQRTRGGRLEDTLVQAGRISPEMLSRSLALQLGYAFVEENVQVDAAAVALVPEGAVRRYNVMPLRVEGNTLTLAMKDPRHVFAIDDIRLLTGKEIRPAVATEETLIKLINRHYKSNENMEELAKAVLEEIGDQDEIEDDSHLDDTALVKVVNNIIREAVFNDISDIHIEPYPDKVLVRVRKDGALREYMSLPRGVAGAVAARIKIMGRLNIAERRLPQDGRVRFKDKNLEVDLRLSTLPTVYGEKVVMRLLKRASAIPDIEQLGFADYNFERFTDTIQKPYGIFLITGPTGSGKSFTTFSILKRIATPDVNVTTVEDPVEYEIPGINQTQVNVKAGLTFASALRAFLRQDPDVIMIGEIRDTETAKIAVEAALTGHLVIATLHTNDATGAVTRLAEMGVEPFNISASLLGVLAQRLVRKVCAACRVAYTPDVDTLRRLGLAPEALQGATLYRGVGCTQCGGSGYNGRHAIHELFTVDAAAQRAIVQGRSSSELKELAVAAGMKTLRDDGVFKALAGITTLEEVLARTTD
ncbi:ATPase, T2SS/T4P/T4SS family [Truepera radiovictrix]|uniref:Type II secretion system protein E n=1 Tax=Truepera radiovictrix (strain DSM 17093 / CIP 108686 / LMG 22925 / RQ-24) TaxID=649638 RepID=D7CSM8_TRURR|nr:ATPase, T2SS/T4P/T4SS family [Truepera radiovictrix]ADI15448.1 type II secretion system protein E [Truepera radiovictrix DSM 17093]WMT56002.1 ATPase, T2SS/T4P/T4SS family [Truepera radiovictrix]